MYIAICILQRVSFSLPQQARVVPRTRSQSPSQSSTPQSAPAPNQRTTPTRSKATRHKAAGTSGTPGTTPTGSNHSPAANTPAGTGNVAAAAAQTSANPPDTAPIKDEKGEKVHLKMQ